MARAGWVLAAFLVVTPRSAHAQLGVSSDRVSLPNGPGSRIGIGANTDVLLNMGQATASVPVPVPQGFPDVTPAISLAYNSGTGSGLVGVGWSISFPTIERMTVRGMPSYTLADTIVADGGTELVRVGTSTPPVYRAREEHDFTRYTWLDAGDGATGTFKAEYADGSIAYFGAQRDGTVEPSAQLGPAGKTFRWYVVHVEDRHGNLMEYGYSVMNGVPLVSSIRWLEEGNGFRYRAAFTYEPRPDALSDARAGFEERTVHRLAAIEVFNGTSRLSRANLTYEPVASSGGLSRLTGIERLGVDGTTHPERFTFTWSQALGGTCSGAACQDPYLVAMGTLGVSLSTGTATLIDVNGDGMPDVVDTSATGAHRIFLSQMTADGVHTFGPAQFSMVGTGSAFGLGNSRVQELDINGDGLTDLVNVATNQVLVNKGAGDWDSAVTLAGSTDVGLEMALGAATVSDDGDLNTVRFFDHNGDKRMDIIRTAAGVTTVYESRGMNGFTELMNVQPLGWDFSTDNVQLSDMNGDGMLDPIRLGEELQYRLNLGGGKWGPVQTVTNVPFASPQERAQVDLEDINGDGFTDLVLVTGAQVQFALNRNGESFDVVRTIATAAGGSIPERTSTTTVFYADMNGNGSDEIVWVDGNGAVTYLELFPGRPNLLAKIENGLGAVTEFAFTTGVKERARDQAAGMPWRNLLTAPMVMVSSSDTYDLLSDVHELVEMHYHHGFYDGTERRFRGFAEVEEMLAGDAYQESGRRVSTFDVGDSVPERHGLLVKLTHEGRGLTGALLKTEEHVYGLCPVEGSPAGITFVCKQRSTTTHHEGRPDAEALVVREEWEYDGYGNKTVERKLGVISHGDGSGCAACAADGLFGAACGPMCVGDEEYVTREFVPPSANGRWLLRMPQREKRAATENATSFEETLTYYDGNPFEGLPLGQLTRGDVSKVTRRKDAAGAVISVERHRYGTHGEVLESLDPIATPGMDGHRAVYGYDATGLFMTSEEHPLEDAQGPYALRKLTAYDPIWDFPTEQTDWMLVRGMTTTARNSSYAYYDAFGRLSSRLSPGESNVTTATTQFAYALASPVSSITSTMRSQAGAGPDLESITCVDGRGREIQKRTRLAQGRYQVSGFVVLNVNGAPVRTYEPYISTSAACESTPPAGTPFSTVKLDMLGREIEETNVSGDVTKTVHLPLALEEHDENDTDASSPHFDTPHVTTYDGLNRVVKLVRRMGTGRPDETVTARYDVIGELAQVTDAMGHVKTQEHDLAGRVVRTVDPNAGTVTAVYDDASNVVSRTDARNITIAYAYDGMNRLVSTGETGAGAPAPSTWTWDVQPAGCMRCTNLPGRVASVTYAVARADGTHDEGQDLFGYHVRGTTLWRSRRLGTRSVEISHTYDNADRLISTTWPGGRTVAMTLDGVGRTTAVPGVLPSIAYDDRGELATIEHATGVTDSITRDLERRVSSVATRRGQDAIVSLSATRDRVGNLLQITDAGTGPRHDVGFTYDAAYRTLEARLGPAASPTETLTYAYDASDNLTSLTSSMGAQSRAHLGMLTYDAMRPNALAGGGGRTYATDAAGNVTTRGSSTLSWDGLGRLRSEATGGVVTLSFGYGASGERVLREENGSFEWSIDDNFVIRDGITELTIDVTSEPSVILMDDALAPTLLGDVAPVDGNASQPDGKVTAADAWIRHAAASDILDVTGADQAPGSVEAMLRSSAHRTLMEAAAGELHLHGDIKGHIIAATDGEGRLWGERSYYPHGLAKEGSAFAPVGFEGLEETGSALSLRRYRSLDTAVARFTSVDPAYSILDEDALDDWGEMMSGYAYAAGNFGTSIDPTGLWKTAYAKGDARYIRQTHKQFSRRAVTARVWAIKAGALKERSPRAYAVLSGVTKALFGLSFDKTAAAVGTVVSFSRFNTRDNTTGAMRKMTAGERLGATAKIAGILGLRLGLAAFGPGRQPILRLLTGRHPSSGRKFSDIKREKQSIRYQQQRAMYGRLD